MNVLMVKGTKKESVWLVVVLDILLLLIRNANPVLKIVIPVRRAVNVQFALKTMLTQMGNAIIQFVEMVVCLCKAGVLSIVLKVLFKRATLV